MNFPLYKFVELEYTYILYIYKYNNINKELRFQMATEEELQILSIGFNSLSILTWNIFILVTNTTVQRFYYRIYKWIFTILLINR